MAKDLIYFPLLDIGKNNYCTTKVYYPHVASRQFNLSQDLPLLRLISFNQGLRKRELLDQDSLSHIKSLSIHLLSCCVAHGYKLNAKVTKDFLSWWTTILNIFFSNATGRYFGKHEHLNDV